MDKNREAIIKVLQVALSPSKDLSPQYIADAILFELEYAKGSKDLMKDALKASLNSAVGDLEADANSEMKQLGKTEVLLKNFIHGKLEAYKELYDLITNA